jgi:hypothetical protein
VFNCPVAGCPRMISRVKVDGVWKGRTGEGEIPVYI